MSYSPTTNSSLRFLCPVNTCQRACISKPGWTAHLRSIHPHLDFSNLDQNPIVNLSRHVQPLISTSGNRNDLASSPVVGHAHTESWSDVEMEDLTLDDANNLPSYDSDLGDSDSDVEYHPVMNGKCLQQSCELR